MFSLTIAFGNTNWRLLYKTEEKANEHYMLARAPDKTAHFNPEGHFELTDDFGQRACINRASINGVMLENLDQSRVGNIEFGMHNARTQIALQKRLQAEPGMRGPMMGGPGIVNPMANGPFNA